MDNSNKNLSSWVKDALDYSVKKVTQNLDEFKTLVPPSASTNNRYIAQANTDWTGSFWIGMLHLAKEYTDSDKFDGVIHSQMAEFRRRLDGHIGLNTHDIGFLYTLSAVANYKLTKSEDARKMIIEAADQLMTRYHPKAKIIQAWGNLDQKNERGRMIIDCNMNLPLLYIASRLTGDAAYENVAYNHALQASRHVIRKDNSTYHTYYMDVDTGAGKFGKTHQGATDDSCWARGQAWAVYGFVLSYLYTGDSRFLGDASKLADYFLARLPEDKICYWDLDFTSGTDQERDSSAAAIFTCGLLELAKQLPLVDENRERYNKLAVGILHSLAKSYTTKDIPESNGLLLHAVYAKPDGKGIDECCIWGDYFFMEALMRVNSSWNSYW